jgi:hypothetical protein
MFGVFAHLDMLRSRPAPGWGRVLKPGFLALILTQAIAASASAVLIDAPDGDGNSGRPFLLYEPLVNVGERGATSAVYLGSGAVLTANHVGVGSVEFQGTRYQPVPGSEVRLLNPDSTATDLLLFEIHPRPDLPPLPIAITPPPLHSQIVIAGNGRDRGDPTSYDPNGSYPPGPVLGYMWGSARHLRYGTNEVEAHPYGGRTFNTEAFASVFDSDVPGPEGQAVSGDSGGAAFWLAPSGEWELAGLILAIVEYPGQPSSASFFGQTTFYADLSRYPSPPARSRPAPRSWRCSPRAAGVRCSGARARRRP